MCHEKLEGDENENVQQPTPPAKNTGSNGKKAGQHIQAAFGCLRGTNKDREDRKNQVNTPM
jgi:hypothetical protein